MNATPDTSAEVLIVGAGLAGVTAASVLARQGVRVVLVDARSTYPPCFKAEKIEPDQAELFRKFGVMESLLPHAGRIREIRESQAGRVLRTLRLEQYGIFYHDMVNAIGRSLPPGVDFKTGRVQDITTSPDIQRVTLASGQEDSVRLVVVAAGTGGNLLARLGLEKRTIQKDQSLAFGFTISPPDGGHFPFDSVTYYPDGYASEISYLTLFRIGTSMRANLFTIWSVNDQRTRSFVRQPREDLAHWLPRLTRVTGKFDVVSKVETGRIDLYRVAEHLRPGLVLLGDAFQSVCPITGTGLSKVLTDVDVLRECVPQWLTTPGMGLDKIADFYANPRKQAVDRESLRGAAYQRRMAIDGSLIWRARRARHRALMLGAGWRDYFRLTRKLTA